MGVKTFLVLTGASRGLGQGIAVEFSKKVSPNSVFVLMARGESGLNETKKLVEEAVPGIKVKIVTTDFAKPDKDTYYNAIQGALTEFGCSPSDFGHAQIIHNAGLFQHILIPKLDNLEVLINDYTVNVASFIILNSQFFKIFPENSVKNRSMVQVTSGLSKYPYPTCGVYGPAKAARDNFAQVFALENPTVDTLSYAPGVMDTELYREGIVQRGIDVDKHIKDTTEAGIMLTGPKSALRLYEILKKKQYVSGSHVDTYGDEAFVKYSLLSKMTG